MSDATNNSSPETPSPAPPVRKVCACCGSDQVLAVERADGSAEGPDSDISDLMEKRHACQGTIQGECRIKDEVIAAADEPGANTYRGVCLSSIVEDMASRRDPYDLAAVAAAQERAREGELEVDDNALTSRGDDEDGVYVQAWLWIRRGEMRV